MRGQADSPGLRPLRTLRPAERGRQRAVPQIRRAVSGADHKTVMRAPSCLPVCAVGAAWPGRLRGRIFVAGHRALTSNVVLAPGAPAPSCPHTGIVGNRSAARRARRRGHREHAPWGFFGGGVETDVRVRSFLPRAPGAARGAGGRHAEAGRLLVARADRPGIAAAVSSFPFSGDANFTGSRRYSTDRLIGAFFLWNEFQLAREAECFRNPAVSFGEIAGRFSARRQITSAGAGRAGRGAR